jgi:long-chain fatty acid transport protein
MKKLILSAIIAAPTLSFAGGFQLNVQGVKSIAMGGAFTGIGSDASTVFFNPGGMSNLYGHNLTAGFTYITPSVSLQTPETANINQTSPNATPFHVYYSGQLTEKISLGFLVNNQFGSVSSFDDNWQGRNIVQNIALKTYMFQPTMAYKIHDKISIGAGFVYSLGTFVTEKAVPVGSATTTQGKAHLEGSGDGVGYNIGIFSNIYSIKKETSTTDFKLGVSYRSKIAIDLTNGEAKFTDIPVSLQNKFPSKTGFVSKLTLPSVFTAGFSVKHTKHEKYSLEFAYDLNLTGWSSYDTLAFDFANNDTPDSKTTKNWQNAITHRFGLDFTYLEKYSVRAGAYYDNSPVKDGYLSPELPDATQLAFTAGLGYKVNDMISVDFGYIRQSSERESSLESANFTAKYRRKVNVFSIGVNIKFGAKKTPQTTESAN